nr:AroA [[Wolbachia] persica] [Francisella persica]
LQKLGMIANYHQKNYTMPLTIVARSLSGGNIEVDGEKSSQFASGLLMAAPFMRHGLRLNSITDYKQPYLDMTTKVMEEFGVIVDIDKNIYTVKKSQYISPSNYVVEPDVSTASYFWAFAAITGQLSRLCMLLKSLSKVISKFLEVLENIGCQVNYCDDGIEVTGSDKLRGIQ